ncbi:hypothetical protein [Pseudomonas purpurea]|uniref:hypothetical protein n=1 Tax=Pseudomonas purpurea TaxID=3136737 RepID=UPI003265E839
MTKPSHYGITTYCPADIPDQAESAERSWFSKFSGTRLPWGNTQDVAPSCIMEDPTPDDMRFWEQVKKEKEEKKANGTYVPPTFEGVELHQKYDHERFRLAQLPISSKLWIYLATAGKGIFFIAAPLYTIVSLGLYIASRDSYIKLGFLEVLMMGFWPFFFSPCSAGALGISSLTISRKFGSVHPKVHFGS